MSNLKINTDFIHLCLELQAGKCDISHPLRRRGAYERAERRFCHNLNFLRAYINTFYYLWWIISLPVTFGISWNKTASEVLRPSAAALEKAAPIASPSLAVCKISPNINIHRRAFFSWDRGCLDSFTVSQFKSDISVSCCDNSKFSWLSPFDMACQWEWPPWKHRTRQQELSQKLAQFRGQAPKGRGMNRKIG